MPAKLNMLSFCPTGGFAVKVTQTVYQAEEDDRVTIRWDGQVQTDMSLPNMICVLLSDPPKVLCEMIRGVEYPQDQQLAAGVRCDGDALQEGRVRLNLFRVTAEDSGSYSCDLAANYNKKLKQWTLEISGELCEISQQDRTVTTATAGKLTQVSIPREFCVGCESGTSEPGPSPAEDQSTLGQF